MKTKAAVLYEIDKPLVIEELELPPLKEGQVLVKILFSGICHSQINEIKGLKGEDKYLPHLLGHEGSGIVEEVGEGVTKVKKGDYVVLSWIKGEGLNNPSSQYLKDDLIINSGAITTFNQLSVISENRIFKIPHEVPPKVAALLGCAIPTGAGIIKNELKLRRDENESSENESNENGSNESEESKSIAIFGIGGIGLSALLYAASLNCKKIIAVDINEKKLEFAKELGATKVINPVQEDPIEQIKELTAGKGVDYSVESSGVRKVMETAFSAINDQGTTIIAGNLKFGEKIAIDPFDLIKGKKIFGTWGGKTKPDEDIVYYAERYLQGELKLEKLISKVYPLDEINEAVKDLEEGKVIRALIDCQN